MSIVCKKEIKYMNTFYIYMSWIFCDEQKNMECNIREIKYFPLSPMLSPSTCHSCVWLQASPLFFTLPTWPSPLSFKARTSISMVSTNTNNQHSSVVTFLHSQLVAPHHPPTLLVIHNNLVELKIPPWKPLASVPSTGQKAPKNP